MIGVVDYGMGNLLSVFNALEMVGGNPKICSDPEDLSQAERIVLPGVGAFRDCMLNLEKTGFADALQEQVVVKGKPILGICVGMQAMASRSYEGGEIAGLGWFDAEVIRLHPENGSLRVPQIGWNNTDQCGEPLLFSGLPPSPDMYYVHSFYMRCAVAEDVAATCEYGHTVTAAVGKGNIFATQFHPEKSQDHGLRVLTNFLSWKP